MKIFVGLGNPGAEYQNTKHNAGFMLADKFATNLNATDWHNKFNALIAETIFADDKILIVKPQTFMNNSGTAVRQLADFYKVATENIIVAHDDMDLPVGKIRLRPKGSGGGHHGVESIIQHLSGEMNFPRVRIGIGRPPENWTVISHVLSRFTESDLKIIHAVLEDSIPAVKCILSEGIDLAMNKFNSKFNQHQR